MWQGALLKRHSGHSLLAINCLCLFFIVGAVPSCSSIYQVFGLYLCAGVCLGLNNGLTNTLITWVHAGHNGASPQSVALLQSCSCCIYCCCTCCCCTCCCCTCCCCTCRCMHLRVLACSKETEVVAPAAISAPPSVGHGSLILVLVPPASTLAYACALVIAVGPWVNLINASFGLGASSAPLLFVAIEHRIGNGLAAFPAIGALAAIPAIASALLRSPQAPPPKLVPQPSERGPATPLKGLGSTHGSSTIAGVDLGSRGAYVRVTVIAPLMLVITLVIGSQISFAGWSYSYAMNRVGMRSSEAAYLSSLFWSSLTVGRLCTIPLAAFLSPGALLIPTMVIEVASLLLIHLNAGSASALWAGTVGAGVGVCALYSNTISMLASYDLLTPDTVSSIGISAAVGHMTMPNFVGHAIQTWGYGYDALTWIVVIAQTCGCLLVAAVVVHLRSHFEPVASSVHGRKLAAARRLDALREAASGESNRVV